jgi:CHAT domain-containing protein
MKKLSLLIGFIFFIGHVYTIGQVFEINKNIRILQKGVGLYQQKEYSKAEAEFLKLTQAEYKGVKINDTLKFLNNFWIGRTYYELKQFKISKFYLDSAFAFCKDIYTVYDDIYLTCIELLININIELGLTNQTIKHLLEKRDILIKNNKVNSFVFANNEGFLGDSYLELDDYKSSEQYYLNSINTFKKIDESENDSYTSTLHNLASLYSRLSYNSKAIDITLEALPIFEKIRGTNNLDYCYILINLADNYLENNQYEVADSYYKKTISILKELVGENHPDYHLAINHYANLFLSMENYQKADSIYRGQLTTIKNVNGEDNKEYLSALKGLYKIQIAKENYGEAKVYLNQSLMISKKIYTDSNWRYANVLLDLGKIYSFELNYFIADSIFTKVLEIYERVFGKNHPTFGEIQGNLAYLYISFGEFSKAEKYIKNELSIYKSNNRRGSYSKALGSYAFLMLLKKDYQNAEVKLLEAQKIQSEIFGESSLNYANTLIYLSFLYDVTGRQEDALKKAKEVSEIQINIFGDNNIKYANTLNLLAVNYFRLGQFELAKNTEIKAIEIYKNNLGYKHPRLVNMFLNLSKVFVYENKYDSALNLIKQANQLSKKYFNDLFFTLTNAEQEKFIYSITSTNEKVKEIFYLIHKNKNSVVEALYDNELFYKGIILRNSENVEKSIKASGDSVLIKDFDILRNLKSQIQQSKLNTISNKSNFLPKEESLAENLEKKIINTLSKYRIEYNRFNITWVDIQNRLNKNEVAIEFINFNYRNKIFSDSILYGALVISPTFKEPKFVYLFEKKQIDAIFERKNTVSDSLYFNQLYQYQDKGKILHELIWKPIESLLIGVKTIYIAPSGILNTINLSALPLNDNSRFGELYNLRILGSTGEIVSLKEQYISQSSINKAWLFGGIDYNNISYSFPKLNSSNEINYLISKNPDTRSLSEKWSYLPNTLYEISSIDTLCRNNNIQTIFLNGNMASKTLFKNISGENMPFIIHIATHSYFFPDNKNKSEDLALIALDTKKDIYMMSDNPLLRSGLIFSGANKKWGNSNYQIDNSDDGILTAYEISNLNLNEAKLVVMSACETGLGEIKGSEGVFGLQRAFKLAGAKHIIMSLWKVPDAQTKELMKIFYENCFNGLSVSKALSKAQSEMSKIYSPYYWAAFKLLE